MKVLKIIKTSLVMAIALAAVGNDVALATNWKNFGAVQPHEIPGYDDNAGWHPNRRQPRQVQQPVRAPIVRAPIANARDAGHQNNQRVRQESKTSCGMTALKTVLSIPKTVFLTMPKAVLSFAWKHKNILLVTALMAGSAYVSRATAPTTKSSCGSCEDQSSFKAKYDDCVSDREQFIGKGLPQCFSASNPSSWFSQIDRRHDCEQACRLLSCIP